MPQRTPQTSQPPQEEPSRRGNTASIIAIVVVVAVLAIYFLNTTAMSWLVPTLVATPQAGAPAAATPVDLPTATAAQGDQQAAGPAAGQQEQAPGAQATEVPAEINGVPTILFAELPAEAHETIALIDAGGPFPFEQDGAVFENREGLLPSRPRGYYREYTVVTPGENDRGARRIVGGAEGELYYTDDHYDSFSYVVR